MKFAGVVLALLGVVAGVQARAFTTVEDEATRLTNQFRQHDPYARVLQTERWRRAQYSSQQAIKASLIRGPVLTGFIRLTNFNGNQLCRLFRDQLAAFKRHGVQRLIIDIRNNPGGQRLVAVCIAGLFLGQQRIVGVKPLPPLIPHIENWVDGIWDADTDTWWYKSFVPQEWNMPVVVLQNRGTASAAEILSAALRDYNRAWILGTRSYGKGRGQEWNPMRGRPDLMIGHTISQFFSPQGHSPEGVGVDPTVLSPAMRECVTGRTGSRYKDPVMNEALAVLDCAQK